MLLIQSHYRQIGIFGTSIYVLHLFSLHEFLEIDGSFFLFQILLNFSALIFKLGGSVATNKKKEERARQRMLFNADLPLVYSLAVWSSSIFESDVKKGIIC
jgi:hypothetical protein